MIPKKYKLYTVTTTVEIKELNPETKKTEVLEDPETVSKTFYSRSTGVHDKKGKEIYEFDILEKGTKYFVVYFWDDTRFFLVDNYRNYYYYHYKDKDLIYYTRIGNLMLNPELASALDEDED